MFSSIMEADQRVLDINKGPTESEEKDIHYEYVLVFSKATWAAAAKAQQKNQQRRFRLWKQHSVAPSETLPHERWMAEYEQVKRARLQLVEKMKQAGLNITHRRSKDNQDKYILVGASQSRLEEQAELQGLEMELERDELDMHFAAYSTKRRDDFKLSDEVNSNGQQKLFRSSQRQHLIRCIIESQEYEGGCGINLEEEVHKGTLTKVFPVHEDNSRTALLNHWVKKPLSGQPLHEIRNYFGEFIAMYFAFIGYYTRWLALASIMGITAFIASFFETSGWSSTLYSVFLALWGTVFLNFWKRREATLTHKWGTKDYVQREVTRPAFKGEERYGFAYGTTWISWETERAGIPPRLSKYYSNTLRMCKFGAGMIPMIMLAVVVILASIGILTFRLFLQEASTALFSDESSASLFGAIAGGVVNALSILILNSVYRTLAQKLNDWENYRTQTEYDNMLIIKTFIFEFVNSYTSLFYVAFFKNGTRLWGQDKYQDSCNYGEQSPGTYGCADELTVQLATILGTNIIVGQIIEHVLPWITEHKTKLISMIFRKASETETTTPPKYEREAKLLPAKDTRDEYQELVIQYGYIILFAAAFPLAPVLALLNNVIEIRTDASKFLLQSSRAPYRGSAGIGVWYYVMEILGILGVLTNCMLIAFTHGTLLDMTSQNLFLTLGIAVVLEHVLLFLKFIVSIFIPDVPKKVSQHIAKTAFIKQELLAVMKKNNYVKTRLATQDTAQTGNGTV